MKKKRIFPGHTQHSDCSVVSSQCSSTKDTVLLKKNITFSNDSVSKSKAPKAKDASTQGNTMTGYVYRGKVVKCDNFPLADIFPLVPLAITKPEDSKPEE